MGIGLESPSQPGPRRMLNRRVLSKEKMRQYQDGARQSAALIPWQKDIGQEGEADGGGDRGVEGDELGMGLEGKVQEKGLLEEIESLCNLSSSLHTSLQLTQVHNSTDKS